MPRSLPSQLSLGLSLALLMFGCGPEPDGPSSSKVKTGDAGASQDAKPASPGADGPSSQPPPPSPDGGDGQMICGFPAQNACDVCVLQACCTEVAACENDADCYALEDCYA